ncbi:MAG TPA: DUF3536 domain-containing protein, partial [Clostridia bacterium]|nr:DUF3536 domain-containing protein [Clostridia bacterium]
LFEGRGRELFKDPWEARNHYISVILDRSVENREKFLAAHAARPLEPGERIEVWKLLELQRHAMLMYTSCGWFFDEVSGIESVQVVQYAARAIQLANELFGRDLEPEFLDRFQEAKSNLAEHCDGRCIYHKFVKPAQITPLHAAAHYAISSVFEQYGHSIRIFSYTFEDQRRELLTVGKTKLLIGQARVMSEITHESGVFAYAMLYMGEHNLTGGVRPLGSGENYEVMAQDVREAYDTADFPETIRRIDRHFGGAAFSLKSLFKDQQRRILNEIMSSTREDMESRFRLIAERYMPLMRFLQGANVPLPPALETVTDYVLHSDLCRLVDSEPIDFQALQARIHETERRGYRVLDPEISFVVKNRLERAITQIFEKPDDLERMETLECLAKLVIPLPLGLNLWKVQNTYWEMLSRVLPEYEKRAQAGDEAARNWIAHFLRLGDELGFAPRQDAPASQLAA